MKYLRYLLLLLLLMPTMVLAKINEVEVSSIELEEKSPNVEIIDDTTIEGSNLAFNNKFYEVNDYIKYRITIKNVSGEDLEINNTKNSIQTKYFLYNADMGSVKKIKKDEEKELILVIKYNNKVNKEDVVSGHYIEKQQIHIGIVNGELIISDSEITDRPVNPLTQDIIIALLLIFILSGVLYFIFKRKKLARYSLLLILLIPVYITAVNTIEVTSSIEVKLVKPNPCTYEGELVNDAEYVNGQYTYYYIEAEDGWRIGLTDADSTDPVTTKMCTTVNEKPVVSMRYTFMDSQASSIDLSSFDTSNITDMYDAFFNVPNVTELDLVTFDTREVTNMDYMFDGDVNLKSIDLHGFETPSLKTAVSMFYNCKEIKEIDLSSFDTSNIVSVNNVFGGMNSLETVNMSGWDIGRLNVYYYLFNYLTGNSYNPDVPNPIKIKTIIMDNAKFGPSMNGYFQFLDELAELSLNNIDISNVATISDLLNGNQHITEIDFSNLDTSNITGWAGAFANMPNLTKVSFRNDTLYIYSKWLKNMIENSPVTEIDLEGATLTGYGAESFSELPYVEVINFKDVDTSAIDNMYEMFYKTSNIKKLDLSSFDTSNVTSMNFMFGYLTNLEEVDVSSFDFSSMPYLYYIFSNTGLKKLDLSAWDVSGVRSAWGIIDGSTDLEELDLSNWDMRGFGDYNLMGRMLGGSSYSLAGGDYNLKYHLKKVNLTNAILPDSIGIFEYMPSVEEFVFDNVDTSNMTTMRSMFGGAKNLKSLDLSSFDTSNVTTMEDMFYNNLSLKELDLSSFNTSNVTDMHGMFDRATSLESIDLSSFDTSKVTNMSDMFANTSSLSEIDVSTFDFSHVTYLSSLFTNTGATVGYAKDQETADLLNSVVPNTLRFTVK